MKNNTRPNRWLELTFGKGPRITHFAAGHDGQHVVMVMEDGSVLFAGTARRGEDGDSSKFTIDYSNILIYKQNRYNYLFYFKIKLVGNQNQ